LFARDKWLRKDGKGLMYPSVAYLYVCPVEMTEYLNDNLKYWSNFHQLNYEPFQAVYKQLMLEKPVVEQIKKEQLIDEEKILCSFDLNSIEAKELETVQAYNLEFTATRNCSLHGFAFWFDVIFTTDNDVVTLSTRPGEQHTHWKQTVKAIYFCDTSKNF
jgi:protein arginine N-methyltransferase 1